ncbi:STE3-domain-containing protein [Phlegmacium glaucopus]|nr:STE3-domain-containing protein [Phlegmacium glaucopus]
MSPALHPEFGPVSIIAALSLSLALPWHWRAGNVATLSIIGWLFVSNIIFAVDAFIWGNNIDIVVPVWCDITTKLIIGATFALPSACLCISIHLEQVASVRLARSSLLDKRRRQYFELGMCFVLPILFMGLHYIVQGHRFDIIEGYGCRPATYISIPAIFIVWIPPVVLSTIAIGYAGLALRHFMIRRLSFAAHLNASSSGLTTSRYLRLMTMASFLMVWSITITSYQFWFTLKTNQLRPWTTWSDVHSDWLRIGLFPALFTPEFVAKFFYIAWWPVPISTFLFVAFFSFGKDATDEYRKCLLWLRVNILRQSANSSKSKGTFFVMQISPTKPTPDLLTSDPKSVRDSEGAESTLPPYSPKKIHESLTDFECDTHSEVTSYHCSSPFESGKAIGSYTDHTLHTPTTVNSFTPDSPCDEVPEDEVEPESTLSPLAPPPPHPRPRVLVPVSSPPPTRNSPRPVTFSSFDFSHCDIHLFKPEP